MKFVHTVFDCELTSISVNTSTNKLVEKYIYAGLDDLPVYSSDHCFIDLVNDLVSAFACLA
jgi:hypothetical protein